MFNPTTGQKIEALRRFFSGNLSKVATEVGCSRQTLHNYLADPGKHERSLYAAEIDKLFKRHIKLGWESIGGGVADLLAFVCERDESLRRSQIHNQLNIAETMLKQHRHYEKSGSKGAIMLFVQAIIWYRKRAEGILSSPTLTQIEKAFLQAAEGLEADYPVLACKASSSGACIYLSQHEVGKRLNDPKVHEKMVNLNVCESAQTICRAEPWNWLAAWNGLISASITRDESSCRESYSLLLFACQKFEDWDFSTTLTKSINKDPDLVFFRNLYAGDEDEDKNSH